ncbi:MAG: signal peptide peptidase SppA [Deltaproteobacteria bacterium]|nr:signal peptide peptidase SppA [Deltaproteobacteria bacterium]
MENKPSRKIWWIVLVIVLLFSCMGGALFFGFALLFSPSSNWKDSWGNIAVVELKGAIFESEKVNEKLEKYLKSEQVKAIVLRIDSPGGAVGPSQEIYNEVKRVAQKKTIVVSMGSVAASGGYYAAAPAHKILANPGTITGSIGVLMEHVEVNDLLKWAKVSAEILKAGEMKDAGSALRTMKPEERAYLQDLLSNMHAQFKKAVAEGRHLDIETVNKLADGRVYTGEQALQLKLVDQLGGLEDAIEVARVLAKIPGEAKVIRPDKGSPLLKALFGEEDSETKLLQWMASIKTYRALYFWGN